MTARFSEVGAPATTGLPSGSLSSRNAAAVNNHVNNTRSNPSAGALAAVWGTRR